MKVYIAGPITIGDSFVHCHEACYLWRSLLRAGFDPFCPHWSGMQQMVAPLRGLDEWLEWDFLRIEEADVLFRIPGESVGADREVEHAKSRGIPVVHNLRQLWDARDRWAALRKPNSSGWRMLEIRRNP